MSDYTEFFLNSRASVAQLECLEITHSLFSRAYRIVRNATLGVTVTHEDESEYDYEYYPLRCSLSGPRDDLDHVLKVDMGDLGEIIPNELDLIRNGDGLQEYPLVTYRTYRSDDLENVLYGPLVLEINAISFKREGAAFEAKAPSLNISTTGERYTLARFPMLRGVL